MSCEWQVTTSIEWNLLPPQRETFGDCSRSSILVGVHTMTARASTAVSDQRSARELVTHSPAMVCSKNVTLDRTTASENYPFLRVWQRVPRGQSWDRDWEGKQRLWEKRTERQEGDPMQTDTGDSGSLFGKEKGDPDHWSSFTKRKPLERRLF